MKQRIESDSVRVVALAGRRTDASDAKTPRFPLSNVLTVREKLKQVFVEHRFTHLVCAAACGADLIALEVAADLGMQSHIILPFSPTEFREISVTDRPGDWGELYDLLVKKAEDTGCLYLLGYLPTDEKAFSKTTQFLIDHAKKLAHDTSAFGAIVWEGRSRGKDDATQEFATLSQEAGLHKLEILTI